jgi:uncharacterized caspase-like protein
MVGVRGELKIPVKRGLERRTLIGRVTAPAGFYALTINGAKLAADDEGLFETEIRLDGPSTPVNLVAIDRQGGRATLAFALVTAGQSGTTVARRVNPLEGVDVGGYHALVIGNQDYRSMPDLTTAAADAKEVAAVLKDGFGFKVTLLSDATRYQVLSELNRLRKKLTDKDNLLIYYAGHGELDEINSRGNWLPVDAEPDNAAQWISNMDLTGILNRTTAKHILVVADSCYAATLTRGALSNLAGGMSEDNRAEWIKQMMGKRSVTVLSSGGDEPVLDGGGTSGHSIFAQALLNVLEENVEVLAGQSLHIALAAKVAYRAAEAGLNQTPQYAPIRYSGHAFGDFFFVRDIDKRRVGLAPFKMLAGVSP